VGLTFNPVTFDLSSAGTVTITITSTQVDLRRVVPSSVRITSAAGAEVSIPTTKWSASAKSATAKFDRVPLARLLRDNGVTNATLPIVVTGTSNTNPAWSFRGQSDITVKP
jgi:hypothetical protein